MHSSSIKRQSQRAEALVTILVIAGVICIIIFSMLQLSSNSAKNAYGRVDWDKSFFIAENAMVWAAQKSFDTLPTRGSTTTYSTVLGTLPTTDLLCPTNADPAFVGALVTVYQPAAQNNNVVIITASAQVNNKIRTLQAQIMVQPPSSVFNYEYFLNNWGWWWGNTIFGYGGQRANWDFDFQGDPTVDGEIYAADLVEGNKIPLSQLFPNLPFVGRAGTDATNEVHQGAVPIVMPNLLNFTNYTATALANTSSNGLWLGSTQIVFGVVSNTYTPKPGGNAGNLSPQKGLYVAGTAANPITIKGTVVIPGDLVIQGVVTGQGTLYVGGNLYVANSITYANGPNFSAHPETEAPATCDAWVAASQTNDLIAYAVRGSILGGDVTSSDWINDCFNYSEVGLANVGDESQLGADGISGTHDDNIPFLHANGTMSTWYDADGDGTTNTAYNYNNDINMTTNRMAYIQGYPLTNGAPVAYSSLAANSMETLDGIFYTDHAAAILMEGNPNTFNGVIVSRNEMIYAYNNINFVYDSRVNSRYQNNPNYIINLGLPYGLPIKVNSFTELAPNGAGL
jgi:hypothetical protein